MSRHEEDEIPPGLKMLIGIVMSGGIPMSRDDFMQAHHESHQQAIREWEDRKEELSERFCPHISAGLIQLQHLSAELCEHGQMATAAILQMLCELTDLAEGDQDIIGVAAEEVRNVLAKVRRARRKMQTEDVEAEAKSKAMNFIEAALKANKSKAEPGTKGRTETKAEARARVKAEVEAIKARRNGAPGHN
jgi:hypothetical protein